MRSPLTFIILGVLFFAVCFVDLVFINKGSNLSDMDPVGKSGLVGFVLCLVIAIALPIISAFKKK